MENMQFKLRLQEVMLSNIPKLSGRDALLLQDNTELAADLQMDSFDIVTIQVVLEDEFNFEFNPMEDDFESIFSTMGNLTAYLQGKVL